MAMERTAWPVNTPWRALLCGYFTLCLTLLTVLLTLRLANVASWRRFFRLSLARMLIIFVLFDSWLFCWASGVILFGVGSALNDAACEVGIWWCIALYASSKIMIYLFLMERLNVVHSNVKHEFVTLRERFNSWWYRVAALLLAGWIGVVFAMCFGRNAVLRPDGHCMIGLKVWATVPMLTVDAIVNIYLTSAFTIPVFKMGFSHAKGLVRSSCIAAIAALVTSFANILILALMHGHQQSFVCLASCVTDVAANACILFFITNAKSDGDSSEMTGPTPSRAGMTETMLSRRASVLPTAVPRSDKRDSRRGYGTDSLRSTTVQGVHIQRCVDVDTDSDNDGLETPKTTFSPAAFHATPTQSVTLSMEEGRRTSAAERRVIAPFSSTMDANPEEKEEKTPRATALDAYSLVHIPSLSKQPDETAGNAQIAVEAETETEKARTSRTTS